MSAAPVAQGRRWFISAPAELELRPLLAALERRGARPYVLSDVAPLGAEVRQSLHEAIAGADRVLVVLSGEAPSLNVAVEAGMALALGKPLAVVADPATAIPSDLSGALTIRARPDDVQAIEFALDHAEGRDLLSRHAPPASGRPLGQYARQLLTRVTPTASETEVADILVEAIQGSGAAVVRSAQGDRVFDLGVWSDDLDAVAANPLVIEIKNTVTAAAVRQALAALHGTPSARAALIVHRGHGTSEGLAQARFPVLAIELTTLLRRMESASFAEIVRELRNRSVHGLPSL